MRSAILLEFLDLGRDLFARHLMTHPAIKEVTIRMAHRCMPDIWNP